METETERMNRLENEIAGIGASLRDLLLVLGRRNETPTPLERPDAGPSMSNPASEGLHAPHEFVDPLPKHNLNRKHRSDT